ncbi:MAG: tetratricopeptide repeat protein [Planctomycetaceae bacterium]|nr:tetratricopeptide repeat protein [Planctomycetaceae bacterium]
MTAAESFPGASRRHEVKLTGLRAGTRYIYQVQGSQTRCQFQTQPPVNSPFSLLLLWGDMSGKLTSLLRSEVPEFVVTLNREVEEDQKDAFAAIRPYVPVYTIEGVDSPFLKLLNDSKQQKTRDPWSLDWAGLRLIFTDKTDFPDELLNAPAAHTIGLIVTPAGQNIDIEALSKSDFHDRLRQHNGRYPNSPVAFVAIADRQAEGVQTDGIRYLGPGTAGQNDTGAIRIDVDVDSARAVLLGENKEIVLKEPPLGEKLTCEDCRRLADKGAYEASIQAYLKFIEANKGHFQIDDAYYAIADIYDFKLFEFEQAVSWYEQLIKEYPNGTLVPLANQRIKHITAYSDFSYEPLTRFERIRAVEYARKKEQTSQRDQLLANVEQLIRQYPDSRLAPVMQLWLANQYRTFSPAKAVEAYLLLKKNYGPSDEAKEAAFEIGSTYYDAGQYRQAIAAFEQAMTELPSLSDTIKAQVARSYRNIRRDCIAYGCWAAVAVIGLLAICLKPRRLQNDVLLHGSVVFVAAAVLLYAGAWMIREQFNSVREMHSIVLLFALASGLSAACAVKVSSSLVQMGKTRRPLMSFFAGCGASVILFPAAIYLAVYYSYAHYLIVVHL